MSRYHKSQECLRFICPLHCYHYSRPSDAAAGPCSSYSLFCIMTAKVLECRCEIAVANFSFWGFYLEYFETFWEKKHFEKETSFWNLSKRKHVFIFLKRKHLFEKETHFEKETSLRKGNTFWKRNTVWKGNNMWKGNTFLKRKHILK
jgi:hypothetical protein